MRDGEYEQIGPGNFIRTGSIDDTTAALMSITARRVDATLCLLSALAIRALARRTGADVQELQTLYVLEALLARISVSPHRDDFVLKGVR